MQQPFKRNFLQHALAVSAWMQQHEARGGIDPRSLSMEISHSGRAVRFYPQFVVEQHDGIGFASQLQPGVSGFVGWLPYSIRGDGTSSPRQLIAAKLPQGTPWPEALTDLIRLQGENEDAALPKDKVIVADYRYMSDLNPSITADHNIRSAIAGTSLERQLLEAGALCMNCVPTDLRDSVAFSLDGIVDGMGKVHFLEINCNPLLHPAFYAPMFDSLFAAPDGKP